MTSGLIKDLYARVKMDEKYRGKVDCEIRLGPYDGGKPTIYVKIRERQEGSLEPALREFFSEVGMPAFVLSGSNYILVNNILQKHNKKLQRKFKGAAMGKHVVDSNR